MFPIIDCANKSLNFLNIFKGTDISQVIGDTGPTQDQVATLLASTTYFVNAEKDPAIPYLYEYAEVTGRPLNLHHCVNPLLCENTGNCLSVTTSNGQLQFQGVPCEEELTPLC